MREDIYGVYVQTYKITPTEMAAAYERAEEQRRGYNTNYMTTITDEAVGYLTGFGSCDIRYWISKHVTYFS